MKKAIIIFALLAIACSAIFYACEKTDYSVFPDSSTPEMAKAKKIKAFQSVVTPDSVLSIEFTKAHESIDSSVLVALGVVNFPSPLNTYLFTVTIHSNNCGTYTIYLTGEKRYISTQAFPSACFQTGNTFDISVKPVEAITQYGITYGTPSPVYSFVVPYFASL